MSLWGEIASQPEVLTSLAARYRSQVDMTVRWLSDRQFDHVMIAARGTSDNAARYAQYLWGARNRLHVSLAAPSLYGIYQSPPRLDGALVLGISQSGESPDLLAVLREGRDQGRPTMSITNHPDSPMAAIADCHFDLGAGPELAVAATKSYTAELFALAALSAGLTGDDEMEMSLVQVGRTVGEVLAAAGGTETAAVSMKDADRCVVLGRGFHHATAYEWALKIAELSYLVAQPFSAADFRHGPLAMIEPGLPVLAVATSGPLFSDLGELLSLAREAGARVVAISDRPDCPADHLIALPPGLPDWLYPIPAIVAAQVFTYQLTRARGLDPDHPRRLTKVTKTM
ncbi:MAG: SIS domain-containing protein [Actinomycetota bacterium]